ncbi:MAG TPA: c-type cytochrome [Steroidobacteraceae bacterium]|jgi:cytochrome c553|nr:c-type cytochrome [Steroidobacteraceae bacterium]
MLARLIAKAWAAGAALTCLSLSAHAAGDPAKGEMKFYTCYGCHGIANYRNAYPDYSVPKLRHQNAAYLEAALHEYRDGTRPHPTMHAQAASLSDQDIEDIAAYLQGATPVKPGPAAAAAKAPKQAAPCVACHGENGLGVDAPLVPKPPVLAGQHVDYLEQALGTYRNGRRKNVVMDSMAKLLTSDEDVKIVAAYFANQASPLATATTESK